MPGSTWNLSRSESAIITQKGQYEKSVPHGTAQARAEWEIPGRRAGRGGKIKKQQQLAKMCNTRQKHNTNRKNKRLRGGKGLAHAR